MYYALIQKIYDKKVDILFTYGSVQEISNFFVMQCDELMKKLSEDKVLGEYMFAGPVDMDDYKCATYFDEWNFNDVIDLKFQIGKARIMFICFVNKYEFLVELFKKYTTGNRLYEGWSLIPEIDETTGNLQKIQEEFTRINSKEGSFEFLIKNN